MFQREQAKLPKAESLGSAKCKKLGNAPNDIYELEDEINSIRNEEVEYESFAISDVNKAREALQSGQKIQINLPKNQSPNSLIEIANDIGFDTCKLKKLFENSSIVVKDILDAYIHKLQSQYAALSKLDHPYKASAFGYLFHCKQVDALQTDSDLSAKVRIRMDLDFNKVVLNDELFRNKFVHELSQNVFKCPHNSIKLVDVRAGSVIAVVAGITLISLATLGLFTFSVKLYERKRQNHQMSANQELIEPPNGQKAQIKLSANKYKEVKESDFIKKPKEVNETFVSSIFGKLKSGIDYFNEQYSEKTKTKTTTKNDNNVDDDEKVLNVYDRLVDMGFDQTLCQNAANKHPSNINEAINWITERSENECKNREKLLLNINDALWIKYKERMYAATVIALSRADVTVEFDEKGPFLWKNTATYKLNDECLVQREPGRVPSDIEGCVQFSKAKGGSGWLRAWKTGLNRPMADV